MKLNTAVFFGGESVEHEVSIISALLRYAFRVYIYKRIAGYIPFIISNDCYVKLVIMGMA